MSLCVSWSPSKEYAQELSEPKRAHLRATEPYVSAKEPYLSTCSYAHTHTHAHTHRYTHKHTRAHTQANFELRNPLFDFIIGVTEASLNCQHCRQFQQFQGVNWRALEWQSFDYDFHKKSVCVMLIDAASIASITFVIVEITDASNSLYMRCVICE